MTAATARLTKKNKKAKIPTTSTESQLDATSNNPAYQRLTKSALACFQGIVKRELIFHFLFFSLGCISLISLGFFFSFLSDSFLMGIFIACFFFAAVLYFVLRLYFQEQKPAELLQLRDEYLHQYSAIAKNDPTALSDPAGAFALELEQSKIDYCFLPKFLNFLKPSLEKLILTYHWRDVHLFRELFLRASIDTRVAQIIHRPTDCVAHRELASAYMELSDHFQAPLDSTSLSPKSGQLFWENFQTFAKLAIEELLIVKEYAPNDLWTSTMLAQCYLCLNMLEHAIVEYEAVLRDNMDDPDALFSLGTLYFKRGLHGKGLRIYEQLLTLDPTQAKELIAMYGCHDSNHFRTL